MHRRLNKAGLHFIKLEKSDWRGDWRGFCAAIKKLDGVTFNPAELDEDNWWYIPGQHWQKLSTLYYDFIGKVLATMDADKQAGFEPIPTKRSSRFARTHLKY